MQVSKQQLLEQLQSNPKVQQYLSAFEVNSAKQFLDTYAGKKESLLQ